MKRLSILALIVSSFLINLPLQAASLQPKRGGTITPAVSKELALMNPLVNTSSTESRILREPQATRYCKGAEVP